MILYHIFNFNGCNNIKTKGHQIKLLMSISIYSTMQFYYKHYCFPEKGTKQLMGNLVIFSLFP